jgi:aminoglycoside 6'-N-acetyltransferase I
MTTLTIRPVQPADAEGWLRLRSQLWPEGSAVEHRDEIEAFIDGRAGEPLAVLVAERRGALVGFAELSIRSCAEGCHTNRIAYLEGWFVPPEQRRQGVGRALVAAAEKWALEAGCTEFASDTAAGNAASAAAHAAVGFENAGTVVCFRKTL